MTKEEAIEIIKRNCTESSQLRDACAMFIPELCENDDERIRKLLVWQVHRNIEDETNDLAQSVYDGIKGHDPDIEESIEDWKRCLAWLEKKKEQNVVPSRETILGIWELGNLWKENPEERNGLTQLQYIQKYWLEKNDYQKEQKPSISCGHENDIEWSEEDEKILHSIKNCVYQCVNSIGTVDKERYINWLKSIRPQPHWKPSEEQMGALNYFIKLWGNSDDQLEYTKIFNTVKSLRDELKSLM